MENPITFALSLDKSGNYWIISTEDKRAKGKIKIKCSSADVPKKMAYLSEMYNNLGFSVVFVFHTYIA